MSTFISKTNNLCGRIIEYIVVEVRVKEKKIVKIKISGTGLVLVYSWKILFFTLYYEVFSVIVVSSYFG